MLASCSRSCKCALPDFRCEDLQPSIQATGEKGYAICLWQLATLATLAVEGRERVSRVSQVRGGGLECVSRTMLRFRERLTLSRFFSVTAITSKASSSLVN